MLFRSERGLTEGIRRIREGTDSSTAQSVQGRDQLQTQLTEAQTSLVQATAALEQARARAAVMPGQESAVLFAETLYNRRREEFARLMTRARNTVNTPRDRERPTGAEERQPGRIVVPAGSAALIAAGAGLIAGTLPNQRPPQR